MAVEDFINVDKKVDVFTLEESLFDEIRLGIEIPLRDEQIHIDTSDEDQTLRGEETYGILGVPYGCVRDFLDDTMAEFEVRDSGTGNYLRMQRFGRD